MWSDERGQASVEWIGLLLLVSMALAAALAFVPAIDGRPLGAAIARALVCAVKGDCHADGAALRRAYGDGDAALVRKHAPNVVYERRTLTLPVDYRRCRSPRCSDAPDDRDLDVHRSARGRQATAFTHVVHRGGRTYIQYWLYYPDSPSTFMGSHRVMKTLGIHDPAFHPDDWEGYQVRIEADGSKSVRASKHGGYTWCKGHIWHNKCERWGPPNGWTRVSRGSHAGHIPDRTPGTGLRERSTTAPGIRLVPLETLDHDTYKPLKGGIDAPWTKEVYRRPESGSS
ncbi:MAG TPA: hypothetical protein VF066_14835 [Thermoleophilaceae bacterium]